MITISGFQVLHVINTYLLVQIIHISFRTINLYYYLYLSIHFLPYFRQVFSGDNASFPHVISFSADFLSDLLTTCKTYSTLIQGNPNRKNV